MATWSKRSRAVRTRLSRFSACNIEKLGVAWGRGYCGMSTNLTLSAFMHKCGSHYSQLGRVSIVNELSVICTVRVHLTNR